MHPDEVGSENPGKNEHVGRPKNETAETDPSKTGQSFKDGVMKLYSSH